MLSDNFSGGNIDLYFKTMTITPSCCTITYSCIDVSEEGESSSSVSCSDLLIDLTYDGTPTGDLSDGQVRLETPSSKYGTPYRPGNYTVTIVGTVDGVPAVLGTTLKSTSFTFELVDPCDPPAEFIVETPTDDFDYTITQV